MNTREVMFSNESLEQLNKWIFLNPKIARKLVELLDECTKTPFDGKGKPEPLKGNYSGYWSRRLTDEHRLIYRVEPDMIYVLSCFGHYE